MLGADDNSESDGEDVGDERGAGKRRVKPNNKQAAQIDEQMDDS